MRTRSASVLGAPPSMSSERAGASTAKQRAKAVAHAGNASRRTEDRARPAHLEDQVVDLLAIRLAHRLRPALALAALLLCALAPLLDAPAQIVPQAVQHRAQLVLCVERERGHSLAGRVGLVCERECSARGCRCGPWRHRWSEKSEIAVFGGVRRPWLDASER